MAGWTSERTNRGGVQYCQKTLFSNVFHRLEWRVPEAQIGMAALFEAGRGRRDRKMQAKSEALVEKEIVILRYLALVFEIKEVPAQKMNHERKRL